MLARSLSLVDTTPPPQGGMTTVRIAIATRSMNALDAHFGSARTFAIYEVSRQGWNFVRAVAFDDVSNEEGKHKEDGDDRITPKVSALEGCKLLFVRAIGGPAAAKVVTAGIHPIKMPADMSFEALLAKVRDMLSGSPPPWLRKIISPDAKPAFDED